MQNYTCLVHSHILHLKIVVTSFNSSLYFRRRLQVHLEYSTKDSSCVAIRKISEKLIDMSQSRLTSLKLSEDKFFYTQKLFAVLVSRKYFGNELFVIFTKPTLYKIEGTFFCK